MSPSAVGFKTDIQHPHTQTQVRTSEEEADNARGKQQLLLLLCSVIPSCLLLKVFISAAEALMAVNNGLKARRFVINVKYV